MFTITHNEAEMIVFLRDFSEWFGSLSAPAQRQMRGIPFERQLSLAKVIIDRRSESITKDVWISCPQPADQVFLRAA